MLYVAATEVTLFVPAVEPANPSHIDRAANPLQKHNLRVFGSPSTTFGVQE
jgi:hypothetical protein